LEIDVAPCIWAWIVAVAVERLELTAFNAWMLPRNPCAMVKTAGLSAAELIFRPDSIADCVEVIWLLIMSRDWIAAMALMLVLTDVTITGVSVYCGNWIRNVRNGLFPGHLHRGRAAASFGSAAPLGEAQFWI